MAQQLIEDENDNKMEDRDILTIIWQPKGSKKVLKTSVMFNRGKCSLETIKGRAISDFDEYGFGGEIKVFWRTVGQIEFIHYNPRLNALISQNRSPTVYVSCKKKQHSFNTPRVRDLVCILAHHLFENP